jgi:hypothetical protein
VPHAEPSVCRAVHYVGRDTAGTVVCQAATITEVGADRQVGLAVATPHGWTFHPLAAGGVPYFDCAAQPGGALFSGDSPHPPGTWHWPERAPG